MGFSLKGIVSAIGKFAGKLTGSQQSPQVGGLGIVPTTPFTGGGVQTGIFGSSPFGQGNSILNQPLNFSNPSGSPGTGAIGTVLRIAEGVEHVLGPSTPAGQSAAHAADIATHEDPDVVVTPKGIEGGVQLSGRRVALTGGDTFGNWGVSGGISIGGSAGGRSGTQPGVLSGLTDQAKLVLLGIGAWLFLGRRR